MMQSGIITRPISVEECPWLAREKPAYRSPGTVVFKYDGPKYGTCTRNGVAVMLEPHEPPFIEIPENAVRWD